MSIDSVCISPRLPRQMTKGQLRTLLCGPHRNRSVYLLFRKNVEPILPELGFEDWERFRTVRIFTFDQTRTLCQRFQIEPDEIR